MNQNNLSKNFLIGMMFVIITIFLLIPIGVIFFEAFKNGLEFYISAISHKEAIDAIKLTFKIAAISVIANSFFGVIAAWCISKFNFPGKVILNTIIDIPFSVSPVIAGFVFMAVFSSLHPVGRWLENHNIQIVFALPGMVLVTIFVTLPFVVKELIPLMNEQGTQEEEAAIMLGANGFQTFFKITLPNIKYGLLHGVLLSSSRAIGEFGAVSIISGHITGLTNTVPLYVEILYNEYNFVAAFAVSSILTMIAILSIILKIVLSKKI